MEKILNNIGIMILSLAFLVNPAAGMELSKNKQLFEAIDQGNTSRIESLLNTGANINAQNEDGLSLLHKAAAKGDLDSAILLLKNHANPQLTDRLGYTPLHIACWSGHDQIATLLLKAGANPNILSKIGFRPLHFATRIGSSKIVQILLDSGALVNVQNWNGDTPFHEAVLKGNPEIIHLLKRATADSSIKNYANRNPLEEARYRIRTRKFSIEAHTLKPIHMATLKNNLTLLDRILTMGENPNLKNPDEDTPLHIAAKRGYPKIVERLLRSGASMDIENIYGLTPFDIARTHSHNQIIDMFSHKKAQQLDKLNPLTSGQELIDQKNIITEIFNAKIYMQVNKIMRLMQNPPITYKNFFAIIKNAHNIINFTEAKQEIYVTDFSLHVISSALAILEYLATNHPQIIASHDPAFLFLYSIIFSQNLQSDDRSFLSDYYQGYKDFLLGKISQQDFYQKMNAFTLSLLQGNVNIIGAITMKEKVDDYIKNIFEGLPNYSKIVHILKR